MPHYLLIHFGICFVCFLSFDYTRMKKEKSSQPIASLMIDKQVEQINSDEISLISEAEKSRIASLSAVNLLPLNLQPLVLLEF